jgi:hypothetical protein
MRAGAGIIQQCRSLSTKIISAEANPNEAVHVQRAFEQYGFVLTAPLLSADECAAIATALDNVPINLAGSRSALSIPWCADLARRLTVHPLLKCLLPHECAAVSCTLFEKSQERNWLVSFHQDLSIPVAQQLDHPGLSGWSNKENIWYVQPPVHVLEQLVAVRLHIDACDADNGPLRVIPGSHRLGRASREVVERVRSDSGEVVCSVQCGGALVMRPLLLHASSKSLSDSRRRVLHFVFGPKLLPFGLRWHRAL